MMKLAKTLLLSLIASVVHKSAAFAPQSTTLPKIAVSFSSPGTSSNIMSQTLTMQPLLAPSLSKRKRTVNRMNTLSEKRQSAKTTTTLSASSDPDLVVGFGMIAAACTPYALGIVFKDFFNDSFFLPIYADDDDGRIAEIGWKVRYATLGLALTTLAFLEVYLFPENDPARILKDSYILWAIFYTEATLKIRREATSDPPILANPSFGGRLGIQLWHLTVVLVLWADVSESYTGNAITNFIKDVFT
jgi:hypothetical protein